LSLLTHATGRRSGWQQTPSTSWPSLASAYLVPASEGGYYRVDADGCPCPDATYRRTLCKHQIAVGMLRIGEAAVESNTARQRV
jgi:hypothetical protein